MRTLSSLFPGAAMFVAALTVNAATVCQGEILNPVTDVCWSCVFPVKIGGKASLTTSVLPDPDTGAGGPFCTCGKGPNLRAGVTFSFWEPLRTAEIVRHAGCLPSMGGVNMGDMGLRISGHVKVHSHEPDGSMKRHTDFRQVHWYATPWLFILEALLDDGCLDQQTFDLAYMSELDPLWDDTLSSFILNPDAALFANPIAQGRVRRRLHVRLFGPSPELPLLVLGLSGERLSPHGLERFAHLPHGRLAADDPPLCDEALARGAASCRPRLEGALRVLLRAPDAKGRLAHPARLARALGEEHRRLLLQPARAHHRRLGLGKELESRRRGRRGTRLATPRLLLDVRQMGRMSPTLPYI